MLDLVVSSDPHALYDVTISAQLGNTCKNSLHSSLVWCYQIRDHGCESEDTCRPTFTKGDYLELNNYFKAKTGKRFLTVKTSLFKFFLKITTLAAQCGSRSRPLANFVSTVRNGSPKKSNELADLNSKHLLHRRSRTSRSSKSSSMRPQES